ncbi:MAG: ABC transporter permease [Chloroflexi bacterium]|nr:ABC transporter permease [Chloroflexota bacterium]
MFPILRHSLKRLAGQILWWGLSLAFLAALLIPFYDSIAQQQSQVTELLKAFPKEVMAFFGNINDLSTPAGYLTIEFFSYMPLVLGIFAVLVGSGLLVGDEERGTLDLVMAYPVSRAAIFWGRMLGFAIAEAAILAVTWLAMSITIAWTSLGIGWGSAALPFVSLFAVVLLFGTLALFFSMLVPSRSMAASLAGFLLVAGYLITSLATLNPDLETINRLSPWKYYQSGDAINGLNLGWLVGLLAASLIFSGLAWWAFERRDIRVGGEGGWHLAGFNLSGRK